MCVIVHKPFDADMPDLDILYSCWEQNPDGAGFAFRDSVNSCFTCIKGIMTEDSFLDTLYRIPDTCEIVFHCRIGTSGGHSAQKTHPFPICKDPTKLDNAFLTYQQSNEILFHNGVVGSGEKSLSDTQVLCASLAGKSVDAVLYTLEQERSSRFLYINGKDLYRVGNWVPFDGCFYSNAYPICDNLFDSWEEGNVYAEKSIF